MVRNVYYSVVSVIVLLLIRGGIQGHPHGRLLGHGSRNFSTPEVKVSTSNESQNQKFVGVKYEPRMKSPDVNLRQDVDSDGEILFPSEGPHMGSGNYALPPAAGCGSATFCEDPPDYPSDFIKTAIKFRDDLKYLAIVDTGPGIDERIVADNDEALCISEDKVIFPKTAESKDNDWLYVVNEVDFPQGVRVEECMTDEETGCLLVDHFSEGYKTSCKQKYIYRQLVSISPNGSLDRNYFRFPASCCCHVQFTGDAATRFGTFAGGDKANLKSHFAKHRPKS